MEGFSRFLIVSFMKACLELIFSDTSSASMAHLSLKLNKLADNCFHFSDEGFFMPPSTTLLELELELKGEQRRRSRKGFVKVWLLLSRNRRSAIADSAFENLAPKNIYLLGFLFLFLDNILF